MTDGEFKLREVIADVRSLRETFRYAGVEETDRLLGQIERKLGGLLPPIGGQFNISLDTVIKPR